MAIFTEITVTERDEDDTFKPVRGSALAPYATAFNELVNFAELARQQEMLAMGLIKALPKITLNIDDEAKDHGGFRVMQHKIVLMGIWGTERLAEEDIFKFGEQFPDVFLNVIEASSPKPNGNLGGLKNYVRRDYIAGERVATWRAAQIEWQPGPNY